MLENTMTTIGEQGAHDGFRCCWLLGSLQTLLDHDALNTSKIHNTFVLSQKNIISIALIVSHTCTTVLKK